MTKNWSGEVAIAGVYEHPGRKAPGVHPFELQAACIRGALEDAGLTLADVDGFATAAGEVSEGAGIMPVADLAEYLGLRPTYLDGTDTGGAAFLTHIGHAAAAIACGQASVVVVSYAATPRSTFLPWPEPAKHVPGPAQFDLPYGPTTVGSYALAAHRHMADFGTTPDQLAQIAVTCRSHAASNEHARFRDPLSVEDVLASPTIASPLHRNDCCVVTDGGGAVVLTSAERARDCRREPVHVLGFGEATSQVRMPQMPSFTETPGALSAPRAFAQAGLRPEQIDAAQLYDSFTITTLLLLEDVGFCEKGSGGELVAGGDRITVGGDIPINTDGGGLSSNHPGRRGIFTVIESVRQLRGEGPGVQVPDCRYALAHGSGGCLSTAATLIFAS